MPCSSHDFVLLILQHSGGIYLLDDPISKSCSLRVTLFQKCCPIYCSIQPILYPDISRKSCQFWLFSFFQVNQGQEKGRKLRGRKWRVGARTFLPQVFLRGRWVRFAPHLSFSAVQSHSFSTGTHCFHEEKERGAWQKVRSKVHTHKLLGWYGCQFGLLCVSVFSSASSAIPPLEEDQDPDVNTFCPIHTEHTLLFWIITVGGPGTLSPNVTALMIQKRNSSSMLMGPQRLLEKTQQDFWRLFLSFLRQALVGGKEFPFWS